MVDEFDGTPALVAFTTVMGKMEFMPMDVFIKLERQSKFRCPKPVKTTFLRLLLAAVIQ